MTARPQGAHAENTPSPKSKQNFGVVAVFALSVWLSSAFAVNYILNYMIYKAYVQKM